jgi:hypothetical protein
VQDFQRREELILEIFLAAADAGQGRGGIQYAAVAHHRRIIRFDAPDRRDRIAVDAIGLFHRVELRLVGGQHLAALGEPVVVHENVEIVPDRLGEFRLRIHQIHDPQIGREAGGETLETGLRDVAACGIRPHRSHALIEIGGSLADRARGHQGMAGGAVLAAPWRRRVAGGRRRLRLRRGGGLLAEHVAEQVRQSATGRLRPGLAGEQQHCCERDRAGTIDHQWSHPPHIVLLPQNIRFQKALSRFPIA